VTRRGATALLGLVLAGCTSPAPVVSPSSSGASPAPASASASASPLGSPPPQPTPSTAGCEPALATHVQEAAGQVAGYRYQASGWVYQEVLGSDPQAPPTTERVDSAADGAFQAPDRSERRVTRGGIGPGEDHTITIGADLFVEGSAGWDRLPGAADPAQANLLAGLIADAGPTWTARPTANGDCRLVARAPLADGRGVRQTSLVAPGGGSLPERLDLKVTDAIDLLGNRNDVQLRYLFDYAAVAIEPPV
jgi:hypothetical protein